MRPSEALAARRHELLALASARGVGRLRVFGSAADGTDRADSDLDLLVDLCTERELHPSLRERILSQARAV
jgi:predicted nucleotidyltransferase